MQAFRAAECTFEPRFSKTSLGKAQAEQQELFLSTPRFFPASSCAFLFHLCNPIYQNSSWTGPAAVRKGVQNGVQALFSLTFKNHFLRNSGGTHSRWFNSGEVDHPVTPHSTPFPFTCLECVCHAYFFNIICPVQW